MSERHVSECLREYRDALAAYDVACIGLAAAPAHHLSAALAEVAELRGKTERRREGAIDAWKAVRGATGITDQLRADAARTKEIRERVEVSGRDLERQAVARLRRHQWSVEERARMSRAQTRCACGSAIPAARIDLDYSECVRCASRYCRPESDLFVHGDPQRDMSLRFPPR